MLGINEQKLEMFTLIWGLCRSVFNMIIEYARTKTASSFLTSAKICEFPAERANDVTRLTGFIGHEMFRESVSYPCDLLRFSWKPKRLQKFS